MHTENFEQDQLTLIDYYSSNLSGYFSMDGLPSILLAWLCIYIFRPIATLIHELGHAMLAHILTEQKVEVNLGAGKTTYSWKVKN